MDNYYYDPYRYGYPPPPDPDPCCHQPPPPPYPPPSLRPTNSFPAYLYPPGAPPAPYLTHSGPLQYPPPPFHPPPSQPQYHYPYPFPSPPLYSHPDPAAPVPTAPPPPVAVAQPYGLPPDPPPPLQQQHSFGHDFAVFNPGELRLPPPHSDSFIAAYGRQENFSSTAPDLYSSDPVRPVTSCLPSTTSTSSSSSAAYPPIDNLLADMRISDQGNPAPEPPTMSTPSPSFHHRPGTSGYPSSSFSGPFSPHAPHSAPAVAPATPFSWSHNSAQSISFNGSQHGSGTQIVPFQPFKTSLKVLLLHGNLDIWIFEAVNLPNMDMFSKTIMDMIGSTISGKLDNHMTSDPYVTFSVTSAVLGRTYVISNSENPVWNQHFYIPVAHYGSEVQFVVKDSDVVGSQLIGTVSIPAEQIFRGSRVEGTYRILDSNGKQCKPGATLRLSIQYIPMEMLSMYHYGVGPGPDYTGVLGTYFPLRRGGMVKLYQDAHVSDDCLPDLKMDQGIHYEHGKCWRDICEAIKQARRLIYITGWSVYHKVSLVRDDANGAGYTLGELLRSKSQEGVRVLLLVWDDPTSRTILGFQKEGIMQTHDEETRKFFKHSSVHVLLCPRSAGKRHSWMKQQEVGIIYTHHQKTVIVDSDAGYNKRKIIAFVGGLDLCDGRYDTPNHHLFRTLHTLHKDDYHNPTFVGTNVGGPREPWHDLHSRIDGPAAYDVLKNFEERWARASKPRGIKKLKNPHDDALLIIERIPDIIGLDESTYINDSGPEGWHVQIFRSIDSNSVKGFPKNPKEASSKNLVCGKNVLIDMSIHTAYVKAIRAAQQFIYIENQYFLGSSYNWESHKDLGANNLIPMEIALKIANKIKANERFSAYIVIPMWPEGVPTGVATQRILFWQNKTMQMMYDAIYKALVEVGLDNIYTPQDYLNFFCLGNREALDGHSSFVASTTSANICPSVLAQKNRRFMIYVHSKGMIVDDEYVIVGSANINQRSLEGTRDTEIAMGAYQPEHTWGRKLDGPRGQIHVYRMSLWAEHIGFLEEGFTHPESLECMRRVRALGEQNWLQYISEEVTKMKGHLLKYPVDVDQKGKVGPLPGCETFPDVGGYICGSFIAVQENLTI